MIVPIDPSQFTKLGLITLLSGAILGAIIVLVGAVYGLHDRNKP